jgi:hypothetical protein
VDLFVKKWNQHDPKELNELWAENKDLMTRGRMGEGESKRVKYSC